ncbi:hypothetical protein DESME_14900 [Desulfitobacterium metallireducens DSM 15288]|uniref:Uncharacterized protein n=1 Tax=Desulfitobacterium metallireducens DSM 15288 TaxID=871968 RepID=W0EI19_9FIRM|nr:hypothetical protein DESME_14900 [Desulfitobacterium metallireducens DSM 15288]
MLVRELTVGASQSNRLKNSILEWPMMNCDGFRPIARTRVGRYGNMGGNAGIPLVPIWDEGFVYFQASLYMYL